MKSILLWCSVMLVPGCCLFAAQAAAPACAEAEFHQFDFWVGDWDIFDAGRPAKVAHARIDSILNGCVLREDYRSTDGHEGQSFTIFDSSRKLWHQTWVTNRGELLEIEGKFANGEMVLSGKNQQGAMVRGTWKPVNNEVREIAVTSSDGEKTWKPWFDITFRRSSGGTEAEGDSASKNTDDEKSTVGALDAEYQNAVKHSDVATIDRILADDFVLITSSGKTYSKADLLEEARRGSRIYEHQEDTDKSVRMFGDTAVVTAKLWEKGTENGEAFDHKLWFSDIYRRTPAGWRYVFAQSAYRPCEKSP
jgi:ketosteroid isomerase-like protein